jgi:hypothetical protein
LFLRLRDPGAKIGVTLALRSSAYCQGLGRARSLAHRIRRGFPDGPECPDRGLMTIRLILADSDPRELELPLCRECDDQGYLTGRDVRIECECRKPGGVNCMDPDHYVPYDQRMEQSSAAPQDMEGDGTWYGGATDP